MDSPTPETISQPDRSPTDAGVDGLIRDGEVTIQIERDGRPGGYSILVRGEVQASSILSTGEHDATITVLEDDTRLLSGSVGGETVGFVLDGRILAAGFDDPQPSVKVDGAYVDPEQWPTVKEYTGFGPDQEPVEDPFPESGELGTPRNDPLNPEAYVVELDADDAEAPAAYCLDVDGAVGDRSDDVTVSEMGDRVYGCLRPGESARVELQGVVTRIETADGIDFSVRSRDEVAAAVAE